MLCYVLSQRIFPKWQFPKGIFPSGNFPNVQFLKWQLPKSVQAAALGSHCSKRRLRGSNLTFWKLPHRKLHIWEVATWEIVTWEVALRKMYTISISFIYLFCSLYFPMRQKSIYLSIYSYWEYVNLFYNSSQIKSTYNK